MPRNNRITPAKLALADALARQGWTHQRIADQIGGVSRSAVSYALGRRMNAFPAEVQRMSAQIVSRAMGAAYVAIARELRRVADEIDRKEL